MRVRQGARHPEVVEVLFLRVVPHFDQAHSVGHDMPTLLITMAADSRRTSAGGGRAASTTESSRCRCRAGSSAICGGLGSSAARTFAAALGFFFKVKIENLLRSCAEEAQKN